jgi:hypothetical protein
VGSGIHPTGDADREGRSRRAKRLSIAAIAVTGFVVLGGCAALIIAPQWTGATTLDPAINTRTGLPDGRYFMTATATFHQDDRCWFRGNPQGAHLNATESPEVTVYGTGPFACAGATSSQVNFTVTHGTATITESSP